MMEAVLRHRLIQVSAALAPKPGCVPLMRVRGIDTVFARRFCYRQGPLVRSLHVSRAVAA